MKNAAKFRRGGSDIPYIVQVRVAEPKRETLRNSGLAWRRDVLAPDRQDTGNPHAVRVCITGTKNTPLRNLIYGQEKKNTVADIITSDQKDMMISRSMQAYIVKIKREAIQNPELARKKAKRALIRTGVLTPDVKPKKKIVSWE